MSRVGGGGEREVVLRFSGVGLTRGGHPILQSVDWEVRAGQRWVVLGPNGAGKTSLLRIASTYEAATRGRCEVLGEVLGRVDVRDLRRSIGFLSQTLARAVPERTRVVDLVVMGRDARLRRWHEDYPAADWQRASALLAEVGCADLEQSLFETLSEGERQRVLVARSLMAGPDLMLFDEPTAGLDVLAREQLVATLARLAHAEHPRGLVFVTHHPEEIPPGFTHALLLRRGRVHAAGDIESCLTSETLSACFEAALTVSRSQGRYQVRLAGTTPP